MKPQTAPSDWERIKNGIFAGESGGDYNALFGFSNRDGGRWSGTKLTAMTVDQAIAFSDPRGTYGAWVKEELRKGGHKPRVATPMGAYQIVGTTLRMAKKELGLTGSEVMSTELQDQLGLFIYHKQGTGAWEGYKGPSDKSFASRADGGNGSNSLPYDGLQDNQDGNPYDPMVHMGNTAPTPPSFQQIVDNRAKPYDTWGEEFGAAYDSISMTSQAVRWMTGGMTDLDFRVSSVMNTEELAKYPEMYHDLILGSGSEKSFSHNIKWIQEDMERQQRLAQGGWSATSASLLAGFADPLPLAVGIVTGGIGVAGRAGLATRAAVGAASGAAFNVGLEVASDQIFDDPYADPLLAGLIGAGFGSLGGILSRNPATRGLADMAYEAEGTALRAAHVARNSTALTPTGTVHGAQEGSIGAARNTDFVDNLIPDERAYLGEVADADAPHAFGGWARFDVQGRMGTSSDPLVRTLSPHFFDDAAGMTDKSVTPFSANTRQTAMHRQELGNFNAGYLPARSSWLKEEGISGWNLVQKQRGIEEFNRSVRDYVITPVKPEGVSPHVVTAANAWTKMANSYRIRQNNAGLSELDANPNYAPMIGDVHKIAAVDRNFHPEAIESMIEAAIRKHTSDLSPEIVSRMAKGYWRNIRKGAYGIEDAPATAIHRGDKDAFLQAMNDNLPASERLTDVEVEGLWRALGGGKPDDAGGGMSHLKKRTLLDYTEVMPVRDRLGNVHNMRVANLFEADMEILARRYSRTSSGRVSFAETKIVNPSKGEMIMDGIRSEGDLTRLKEMVTESFRKSGRQFADYEKELKNQLENIDFGWKRINGIPVWDNASSFNQWARRIKTSQFIRLMSNMGLNQFQEGWKIMALTGFRASLSQMPSIKTMVRGIHDGRFDKDKILTELTDMTGIGMDGMGSRADFRMDDDRIGSTMGNRFTQKVDQLLDAGQSLTTHLSLMKSVQEFQQRWALKAITQQMVHMARKAQTDGGFDFALIKQRDRDRLANLGIGDKEAKKLFKNLLNHAEYDGKKIVGMGLPKWDAEAVSLYRSFLGRYTDRLVQQNDYGSLAKWMSGPVGSMFIQFRSFVLGAWAKSTLHSMNHGKMGLTDPKVLTLVLGELAMGVATYLVRQSGSLVTEDSRREFFKEKMQWDELAKNGWARTATASVLPMIADSILLFTPAGPQFGNARSSGSPSDPLLGNPASDQLTSLKRFSSGAMRAATGGAEMSPSEVRSGVRALPLPTNWLPFTAAMGALIK